MYILSLSTTFAISGADYYGSVTRLWNLPSVWATVCITVATALYMDITIEANARFKENRVQLQRYREARASMTRSSSLPRARSNTDRTGKGSSSKLNAFSAATTSAGDKQDKGSSSKSKPQLQRSATSRTGGGGSGGGGGAASPPLFSSPAALPSVSVEGAFKPAVNASGEPSSPHTSAVSLIQSIELLPRGASQRVSPALPTTPLAAVSESAHPVPMGASTSMVSPIAGSRLLPASSSSSSFDAWSDPTSTASPARASAAAMPVATRASVSARSIVAAQPHNLTPSATPPRLSVLRPSPLPPPPPPSDADPPASPSLNARPSVATPPASYSYAHRDSQA
jgi:hypothetical protein